jgi:IS30 family transposase
MVLKRPPQAHRDRHQPGHWEGNLLVGRYGRYLITLVERHGRYLITVVERHGRYLMAALPIPDAASASIVSPRPVC